MTQENELEITLKDIDQKLKGFQADERESSILIDYSSGLCYVETTHPATARRLLEIAKSNPEIISIDRKVDSFRMVLPKKYVRQPELIIKPSLRVSTTL